MPRFTKAPAEVIATFDAALARAGSHERRTMFGYPAAFTNTQMFACVFQDRIMLRLAPADRERALAIPAARLFEPMPGRPMKEYVDLPPAVRADAESLGEWFRAARAYAASLPPKRPKGGQR
jgi:TfoX/Sxy family transcriptional regulator of competence genes